MFCENGRYELHLAVGLTWETAACGAEQICNRRATVQLRSSEKNQLFMSREEKSQRRVPALKRRILQPIQWDFFFFCLAMLAAYLEGKRLVNHFGSDWKVPQKRMDGFQRHSARMLVVARG